MFSSRTNWLHQPNQLAQALSARRESGKPIFDLTISNPTEIGFQYPSEEILTALSQAQSLRYNPDPRGLLRAREAVSAYYLAKSIDVHPSNIILTASTSESYSHLFRLLCESGDNVLVPTPSYPLFEFLAQLNDVQIRPYHLRYDGEWHLEVDSLKKAITPTTKAIVVINPHNPTGMFLKKNELASLNELAARHNLALIVDEVFADYGVGVDEQRVCSTAANADVLTCTMNGISKLCGLPQLKLGWIVVSGREEVKNEALQRLEIIADTFLSVNTPAQVALPQLLKSGETTRSQIRERTELNASMLKERIGKNSPVSLLAREGGWSAVLKIPNTRSEEEWALNLLDEAGVYVFPGYFFEFQERGYLVVSLLCRERLFSTGMGLLTEIMRRAD